MIDLWSVKHENKWYTASIWGITWETDPEERILAKRLIDFLEGKRVLYNDCKYGCENCKERSSKSVLEIKSFASDMLYKLSKETDYKKAVRGIRQESNKFLNDVGFEEAYTNIIYAQNKSSCPILKYRMEMAEHVLKIMNMFDIREVGDLFYLLQEYIK